MLPLLEPDYVAQRIVGAVLTNQSELVMPRFLYVTNFLARLAFHICFLSIDSRKNAEKRVQRSSFRRK